MTPSAPTPAKTIAPAPRLPQRTRVLVPCAVDPVYRDRNPYNANGAEVDPAKNPLWQWNYPYEDYALACGAEPAWVVNESTFNSAALWTGIDPKGDGRLHALPAVPQPAGRAWGNRPPVNNCDPPNLDIARCIGELAADPARYHPTPFPANGPVFIDLEAPAVFGGLLCPNYGNGMARSPLADRLAAVNTLAAVVNAVRAGAGTMAQEVYAYNDLWLRWLTLPAVPEPEILAAWAACDQVLSGATACEYFSDTEVANPRHWAANEGGGAGMVAQACPQFERSKFAFVCPTYCTSPRLAAQNNTPVPLATWQAQIERLVTDGWGIVLWMGNVKFDGVAGHLKFAAGYGAGG